MSDSGEEIKIHNRKRQAISSDSESYESHKDQDSIANKPSESNDDRLTNSDSFSLAVENKTRSCEKINVTSSDADSVSEPSKSSSQFSGKTNGKLDRHASQKSSVRSSSLSSFLSDSEHENQNTRSPMKTNGVTRKNSSNDEGKSVRKDSDSNQRMSRKNSVRSSSSSNSSSDSERENHKASSDNGNKSTGRSSDSGQRTNMSRKNSVRSSSSSNSSSDSEHENHKASSDKGNKSTGRSSDSDQRTNMSRKNSVHSSSSSTSSDSDSRKISSSLKKNRITKKAISNTEDESTASSDNNERKNNKKSCRGSKSNADCEKSDKDENDANSTDLISNKIKPRRYKLLSDDDLSDGGDAQKSTQNRSDSSNCNSDASKRTIKRMDKNKRLRLNDMKRKEMEKLKSASKSFSDSESENNQSTFHKSNSKPIKRKRKKKTNENCGPDSENEAQSTKKSLKSNKTSKQKQPKVDPMFEIKSKTQKMIREGRIALPYHQPKKHSLDEFLERRKNKLSMPIKASLNVLNLIDKRLSKREEELVEFYKSESEHTDQEDCGATIPMIETFENDSAVVSQQIDPKSNKLEEDVTKNYENQADVTPNVEDTTTNLPSDGLGNADNNPNAAQADQCVQDSNSYSNVTVSQEGTNADEVTLPNSAAIDKNEIFEFIENNTGITNEEQTESKKTIESATNDTQRFSVGIDQNVTVENIIPLPDGKNNKLIIQDSIDDTNIVKPSSDQSEEFQTSEANEILNKNNDKNDIRSKKLALLSRLNLPIRRNVGLSVNMGDLIELEEEDMRPKSNIFDFIEKFAAHVGVNKSKTASKNKLSVVTIDSQSEIADVEEKTIELEEENVNISTSKTKPGSRYIRFKNNILKTMISKKEADWEMYQSKKENLFESRESVDEDSRDIDVFDKPNFEPYHPEEELDDDELEENDIIYHEKKQEKNDFVDDEAEVSYDEEENINYTDCDDEDDDDRDDNNEESINVDEACQVKNDDEKDLIDVKIDENEASEMLLSKKKEEEEEDTLSLSLNDSNFKKPATQKKSQIFKYNTTGDELENKVLGLESIVQESNGLSQITNSQIFELCSGKFATQPDLLDTSATSDSENLLDSQSVDDSQNFHLTLTDTNDEFASKEITNDGFCTIESTNHESILDVTNDEFPLTVTKAPLKPCPLFLSDDESDKEELFAKKRKAMRIQDSDDETNEDEKDEADDFNDMVDDEDVVDEELDYNSEEEVIVKEKAREFFENEAELSESEWGSEDENENDLDELEKEVGDEDDIDQEKLKDELGKIHMRQMLDDDQHDVRMLQEFLLEDGELHSESKRERKFQWKNQNDTGFWNINNSDDEQTPNEVVETDESWRKIRHEREMYIAQQEKKEDLLLGADEVDNNLPSLPKNSRPNPSGVPSRNIITHPSPNAKFPFQSKIVCGSFLTKGKLLNRLAVTVCETKDKNVIGCKNHRNFVFGTISPEKKLPIDVPVVDRTEKRKISNVTSVTSKRIKLGDGTNVAVKTRLLAQLALTD